MKLHRRSKIIELLEKTKKPIYVNIYVRNSDGDIIDSLFTKTVKSDLIFMLKNTREHFMLLEEKESGVYLS